MSSAPEPPVPTLPAVGDVLLQKYRIERCIGRGGMGAVYLARHEVLNQYVAIKLLLPEIASNPEAVSRFLNEARAAAQIHSEHVAKVLDIDTLPNGGAFMVLEYLEGYDLATYLEQRGRFSVGEAVDFVLQSLEAIAHAHALGIVHRDLKPANLFLTSGPDSRPIIKVLDFGLSKASHSPSGLTSANLVLGSPLFMSPEQLRSSRCADVRADIWSIGICLYQFVTGEPPFKGETFEEIFAAVIEAKPKPPSQCVAGVPGEIDSIIGVCLQRDREERYANVGDLAMALGPLAPPEARASVDRIQGTLNRSPGEIVSPQGSSSSSAFPTQRPQPRVLSANVADASALKPSSPERDRGACREPGISGSTPRTPLPASTPRSPDSSDDPDAGKTIPAAERDRLARRSGPRFRLSVGLAIVAVVAIAAAFAARALLGRHEPDPVAAALKSLVVPDRGEPRILSSSLGAEPGSVATSSRPASSAGVAAAGTVSVISPPAENAETGRPGAPGSRPTDAPSKQKATKKPIKPSAGAGKIELDDLLNHRN